MKSWKFKLLSSAIALSVVVPTASFAADSITNKIDGHSTKPFAYHQKFDQAKHQQMQEQLLDLVTKYTPADLAEWKTALAEREKLMTEMWEKQPQLSDEVKEKVKAIHEDMVSGKITKEQADAKLKELGIERPERSTRPDRSEMSPEVKEKLNAIREDVKNGKLTQEQGKEEMKKLGFNAKEPKGYNRNDIRMQLSEAVKASDDAKIKELLPQMLKQMQERNQQISDKLVDTEQ